MRIVRSGNDVDGGPTGRGIVETSVGLVSLLTSTDRLRDLLTKISRAVLGESFADADPVSYQAVDALLRQRNDLVHAGITPDPQTMRKQLLAVQSLLAWLDQKAPPDGGRTLAVRKDHVIYPATLP